MFPAQPILLFKNRTYKKPGMCVCTYILTDAKINNFFITQWSLHSNFSNILKLMSQSDMSAGYDSIVPKSLTTTGNMSSRSSSNSECNPICM